MKRLTKQDPNWIGEEFWCSAEEPDVEEIDEVYLRLREYENYAPIEQVQEWAVANKENRMMVLPCKVGDTVYWLSNFGSGVNQGRIVCIKLSDFGIDLEISQGTEHQAVKREFERVYLTREEAEAALEEQNDKP